MTHHIRTRMVPEQYFVIECDGCGSEVEKDLVPVEWLKLTDHYSLSINEATLRHFCSQRCLTDWVARQQIAATA